MFERAGYSGYADIVRSIFCTSTYKQFLTTINKSMSPTAEPDTDFQSPASKRQCTSTSLCYVERHLVDLVRWKEEGGTVRDLDIQSNRTHKWMQSAIQLRLKQRDTQSTKQDHGNRPSVATASGNQGVDDASDSSHYPKFRWELNNLLEEANLSEIAKELNGVHKQSEGKIIIL